MVKCFFEYINEELNFLTSQIGDIEFEDRWFYYEPEDEIIYGCDEQPVDKNSLFYFNPKKCIVYIDNKENRYNINDPYCLISYNMNNDEIKLYSTNIIEYLETLGYNNSEIDKLSVQKIFDKNDDYRFILIYGNKLIASTFDIIEEN